MLIVGRKYLMFSLLLLLSVGSHADSTFESFTKERFDALQAQGVPVLVDVHAVWCPTCKRQGKVLREFQKTHEQCNLTILSVDFDDQKEWVTYFKAPRQSTLVLFNNAEKVWFSVAEIRASKITNAITGHIKEC